jgi:hypothetical protein
MLDTQSGDTTRQQSNPDRDSHDVLIGPGTGMVSYPNPWFQLRTGTPGVFLPVPVRAAPRADHLRNKHSLGTESGSASDAV